MSLRKKIFVGYGIVLILIVIVLVWSLVHIHRLGQASDSILSENYKSILAAQNMIYSLERQDNALLLLLHGRINESQSQFSSNEIIFVEWLGRAKDNITVPGEDSVVNNLENAYNKFLIRSAEFKGITGLKSPSTAIVDSVYFNSVKPAFDKVYINCVSLRELNQETMFKASNNAARLAGRANISMIIIGLIVVFAGIGFSLFLSNLITRPIRRFIEGTKKIADGDYNVTIMSQSSDEFGRLAGDFNTMAQRLKSYNELNIERLVSERRKSDAIISSIDEGLVFVDEDFRIINMNPAAGIIFDIDIHTANNKHFLEVIKQEALFNYIKEAAEKAKNPVIEKDKNILTINRGSFELFYEFFITSVKTEDGLSKGVVLLLRDVTRLKELDNLKSQFIMTASHELRTPLTGTIMSIDLLIERTFDKLEEKDRELLNAAKEDLYRLRALVNDLLELSRIESGNIGLVYKNIELTEIFERTLKVLKPQADEKGIELTVHITDSLPVIKGDPDKIMWVITNLVSNALRYTDREGYIKIKADAAGSYIQFSVSDNGDGIPFEYQSRIFDKFVQINSKRESGGSGLGLAICKEIVRAHGGSIWVDSVPEKGSTFYFTIPVTKS